MGKRILLVAAFGMLLSACGTTASDPQRATITAQAAQVGSLQATVNALAAPQQSGQVQPTQDERAVTAAPAATQAPTPIPATATSAPSATPVPTATPAPKPGDVLYQADWSNGLNGWSGSTTGWKTVSGMLIFDGQNGGAENWIAAPLSLNGRADYAVEAKIQVVKTDYIYDGFGIVLRVENAKAYVAGVQTWDKVAFFATLNHYINYSAISKQNFDPRQSAHTYRAEVKGNSLRLLVDGAVVVDTTDNLYLSPGKIGLDATGCQISVQSFKVITL